MLSAHVKAQLERKPFEEFTIRTADGEALNVPTAQAAFMSPGGETLFVFVSDQDVRVIDVRRITQMSARLHADAGAGRGGDRPGSMLATEIEALMAQPSFRSFTIHTAEAQSIPIEAREKAFLSPKRDTLFVFSGHERHECLSIIDVRRITQIERDSREVIARF